MRQAPFRLHTYKVACQGFKQSLELSRDGAHCKFGRLSALEEVLDRK